MFRLVVLLQKIIKSNKKVIKNIFNKTILKLLFLKNYLSK